MNSEFISALQKVVPEGQIIVDTELLEAYSHDETRDVKSIPDIAVVVSSTQEVAHVLRTASEYNIPVTPRGAGTGVTGGAIPVKGGVVLSLEKMNSILEIDQENLIAVVEPGVITGDLQRKVLEHGLMYPPDTASLDSCNL